jgi:hypothetical protein
MNDKNIVNKGEIMKSSYLSAVLALTFVLGVGITAHAQNVNGVVVTVPFEFVAGGATLPAGEYRISPLTAGNTQELSISGYKKGSAFLLPIVFDGVPTEKSALTFEHVGGKYFLSSITTLGGVYTMATPREMIRLGQMNTQDTMPSAGTK